MSVQVREQQLPGIGRRYELDLENDTQLVVIAERGGGRRLAVTEAGHEATGPELILNVDQAATVGALLLGARFSVEPNDSTAATSEHGTTVVVETATLSETSPAVGKVFADLPFIDHDCIAILAVISDETPGLIKDTSVKPTRPGDRLVVAAQREHIADVIAGLVGTSASGT